MCGGVVLVLYVNVRVVLATTVAAVLVGVYHVSSLMMIHDDLDLVNNNVNATCRARLQITQDGPFNILPCC